MNVFNPYKITVKKSGRHSEYTNARIHISLGGLEHEDDKFSVTMGWAADRFERVIICVNDTLHRYNRMFEGYSEEMAQAIMEQEGHNWVKRNKHALGLAPNVEIIYWNYWLQHKRFKEKLETINQRYESDPLFKQAIEDEILAIHVRRKLKGSLERFMHFSCLYLKEEIAAFQIMFEEDNAADIYPGSSLLPCALNNKSYTRIGFKRAENALTHVSNYV